MGRLPPKGWKIFLDDPGEGGELLCQLEQGGGCYASLSRAGDCYTSLNRMEALSFFRAMAIWFSTVFSEIPSNSATSRYFRLFSFTSRKIILHLGGRAA